MYIKYRCLCLEQEGSGFQRLLQEQGKSSGPKVLKGLPIRQRTPQQSSTPAQPAALEPTQEAQQDSAREQESNLVTPSPQEATLSDSSRGTQTLLQEKLHAADKATETAGSPTGKPSDKIISGEL